MAFQGFTTSPPYGGLDLVSPIDNMEPQYALELINVFPGNNAPTVRLGYQQFANIGITDPILFTAPLYKADGTSLLVVATRTKLYSITTGGVVTDRTGTTTPTSGEWQSVVYNNRIYLCNGVDNAQVWDGSAATFSDITFSGVSPALLINVHAHKERLYFVEENSCKFWYGGFQITGTGGTPALTAFDLSYVFTRGGSLLAIGSFSNTTSTTSQEYFWGISSEGEIVFYNGTYAGDASSWGIVARYIIGRPLGYRSYVRVNNDIWFITEQGIVPLSSLFQSDPEQALNSVGYRINPLVSETSAVFPFDHQWTGFFWPQGRRVYIHLPTSGSGGKYLVYAIDTKGWTIFQLVSDEHALSGCVFNKLPFYGSSTGIVWQGETGQADAVAGNAGQAIVFLGRSAFSFFGSRSNYKAFKDIRPLLKTRRGVTLNIGLDTDFKQGTAVTSATSPIGTFTPWGAPWGSPWSSGIEYTYDRFATKGQGHSASIRFGGSLKDSTMQILGFEIRYDMGGQV
jgi:hypothetical protein